MLKTMIDNLTCDFCEGGRIYYDPPETFESYFIPETFILSEIKDIIDKTINEYLVFKCPICGSIKKYTFKDIEKKVRETMYSTLINMIAIKELRSSKALNLIDKTLIYCGKCPGLDGKGACPVRVFEECKLKRLPSEL